MSDKKVDLSADKLLGDIEPKDADSVDSLLRAIKAPHRTKFLCVCDGSGSVRSKPGGYAACIVRLHDRELFMVSGSVTNCTSQEAEVRAVFEALHWLIADGYADEIGGCHAEFIVDSKYSCGQVNGLADDPLAAMNFNKHAVFLAGIQTAARLGVTFRATHIARNVNPLMVAADKSSKILRKSIPFAGISRLLKSVINSENEFSIARQTTKSGGKK